MKHNFEVDTLCVCDRAVLPTSNIISRCKLGLGHTSQPTLRYLNYKYKEKDKYKYKYKYSDVIFNPPSDSTRTSWSAPSPSASFALSSVIDKYIWKKVLVQNYATTLYVKKFIQFFLLDFTAKAAQSHTGSHH